MCTRDYSSPDSVVIQPFFWDFSRSMPMESRYHLEFCLGLFLRTHTMQIPYGCRLLAIHLHPSFPTGSDEAINLSAQRPSHQFTTSNVRRSMMRTGQLDCSKLVAGRPRSTPSQNEHIVLTCSLLFSPDVQFIRKTTRRFMPPYDIRVGLSAIRQTGPHLR